MADPKTPADLKHWTELATKERKGTDPTDLVWHTPEGLDVKPLYTAADVEGLDFTDTTPATFPFIRGPRATMYAGQPWTIRQYAGFSTAEESNGFYRANLAAGQMGSRSPSTSRPTAVTTRTTRASSATSGRRASRSTRSRT